MGYITTILSQPLLLIHIRLFRHQHLRLQLRQSQPRAHSKRINGAKLSLHQHPPFNPDLRSAISPPSCLSALRRHLPIRPAQPTHPAPNSQPRPQPPRARTSTAAPRPPRPFTLFSVPFNFHNQLRTPSRNPPSQ